MATSSGSLASKFGAIGEGHSPAKVRESQLRTTSSIDLVEQIRKLELEGLKLRSEQLGGGAGITIGGNLDALDLGISSPVKTDSPKFTSTSPSSLSALVDIAAEQKTIDELRQQLDAQRRESERLHQTLLGDRYSSGSSSSAPLFRISSSPSRTGFSTLPSTDLFSSRRGTHSNIETGPPSHLEKALKDSQEQVTDLRRRLAESNEMSEQQKRQFRQNIEELKAKLQESFTNRDSLLELRQKESAKHESQVAQLQASLQHLQDKCRAQDEALIEASKKADGYHRENYITETTINQMRLILADCERRRSKPYFDNDPVSAQNPSMLVHTLERCIQELTRDAEARKSRNEELEKELKDLKQEINTDQETLTKEHQQKIAQMTTENDRQLQAANERASNARKQAANIQSQLTMLQGQYEQQTKIKEEMVNDLENKVRHLRNEHSEDRVKWQEQKESLEKSLEQLQKELTLLRSNRDETLRNQAALETKLAELQGAYGKASQELEEEKKNVSKHWEREGELRLRQTDLESRLEEKHRDIERLEKMLNMVRQECNATVSEKVSNIEKQERERHLEKISTLTAQLSEASEKCNRQTLAAEKAQMELTNLKQQMREQSDKFETTRIQYDAAAAEKKHLTDMLSAKTSDYDRLSQERDYYFNLIEQKNSEITQLQAQRERLTVQLEEKEKNALLLKQQSDNFSQLVEANSRSSDTIREERELLTKKLKETTDALEELRTSREVMSKKMKLRERRIKDLEEEKHKVIEEMDLRKQEMAILKEEKDTLFKELKESRYEVASLTEERDTLKRNMANQKYNLDKEIERYKEKFKAIDYDMKLTQKAMKKQESVDNRAVKVADKMQKEITAKRGQIDSLQSKVRWLEEKIDSQSRTRVNLETDKERLKTSLNKALLQNQELSADLEVAKSRCDDLRAQVKKLETSLEKFQPIEKILHKAILKKATVKQASSQAQLEQFEQELTRLKLKHQLDVKEAVQKVNRTLSEGGRYPQIFSTEPTTSSQVQQANETMSQQASPRKITQSSEEYKEIGHELKNLLQELKGVLSDKKDNNHRPTSHFTGRPVRQENVRLEYDNSERPVEREISWPSITKEILSQPSAVLLRPVLQSSYAPPSYPSQPTRPTQSNYQSTNYQKFMSSAAIARELNYLTDLDADERQRRTRSKSMAAVDLSELSGHRDNRPRSASPVQHRQRSRSAEISLVMPKNGTFSANGDKLASEMSEDFLSTFLPSEFDMKEESYSTGYGKNGSHSPTEPNSLPDNSNFSTSLGLSSHIEENTKGTCDVEPASPAKRVPDTHELCRRLEEKILHLSKMGNNLQKENKDMADIIKDQGKKLKKVKETEKKFRKPAR